MWISKNGCECVHCEYVLLVFSSKGGMTINSHKDLPFSACPFLLRYFTPSAFLVLSLSLSVFLAANSFLLCTHETQTHTHIPMFTCTRMYVNFFVVFVVLVTMPSLRLWLLYTFQVHRMPTSSPLPYSNSIPLTFFSVFLFLYLHLSLPVWLSCIFRVSLSDWHGVYTLCVFLQFFTFISFKYSSIFFLG